MRPPQDPSKLFTLYGLKRPDDNIIRYIGITCGPLRRRLARHRFKDGDNIHKENWIRKMLPLRPEIIPYAVGLSLKEACELERFVIAEARKCGFDLINQTDGGEGTLGHTWTEEKREQMSSLMLGNKYGLGHVHSPEIRKQISAGLRGKPKSVSHRKNLSVARTGKKQTIATCEKISMATKGENNPNFGKLGEDSPNFGKKRSPEARKNSSAGQTKRWEKWRATKV